MKQDSNFCLGLVTAAPTGAVDSQEVRVVMAALDLMGVVQPAMMETAAAYCSQVIQGQPMLNQRVSAKIKIRDGQHLRE
jgi:hypothetical protein